MFHWNVVALLGVSFCNVSLNLVDELSKYVFRAVDVIKQNKCNLLTCGVFANLHVSYWLGVLFLPSRNLCDNLFGVVGTKF